MAIGYREAIRWIAYNDEPAETDAEAISMLISVCLIADLSGKDPLTVARAVLAERKRGLHR